MKLWGGRFEGETDAAAAAYLRSFRFDARLAAQDVRGSIAHARMLGRCGIVTQAEADALIRGLEQIRDEVALGQPQFAPDSEDIHTAVEVRLGELVGPVAGRLHTARSRNDQVATDVRLWLKAEIAGMIAAIAELQGALLEVAKKHVETVMPGFTHLQHAQPIVLAHHLLAYVWMLDRDRGRFADGRRRLDACPLGSAALAGTGFPIDRHMTATELGFASVCPNSLDAVSDRDFVVETLAAAALCMAHLSRLAQEITLWAAPEFGWIALDDAYATGSSIMPQKKNPDVAELTRGRTGRLYGHLLSVLTVLKGLPLAYNTDLQEDKEALFDTVDVLGAALRLFAGMLRTAQWRPDRMRAAADDGFAVATDIADYLAQHGVPFREAHGIVGRLVRHCLDRGLGLADLTNADLRGFWEDFPEDYRVPTVVESAASRNSEGGTAPKRVREQMRIAERALNRKDVEDSPATQS